VKSSDFFHLAKAFLSKVT